MVAAYDSCFNRHCSPPDIKILDAALAIIGMSISQYSTDFTFVESVLTCPELATITKARGSFVPA